MITDFNIIKKITSVSDDTIKDGDWGRSFNVEIFNANDKTFKAVYTLKYPLDNGQWLMKNVFLKDDKLILLYKFYNEEKIIERLAVFDLKTFEEISNVVFNFDSKTTGESVTLLKDGRLLVTGGGFGYRKYNKRAYIYDIEMNRSTPLKNKIKADYYYNGKSVVMKDGKVFLFGGLNFGQTEIFVP